MMVYGGTGSEPKTVKVFHVLWIYTKVGSFVLRPTDQRQQDIFEYLELHGTRYRNRTDSVEDPPSSQSSDKNRP
jgi:hypothetical protein